MFLALWGPQRETLLRFWPECGEHPAPAATGLRAWDSRPSVPEELAAGGRRGERPADGGQGAGGGARAPPAGQTGKGSPEMSG